jgi:replicative DNA helicase
MNHIQRMMNMVKRGLQGLNKGIAMGLPRLEAVMDGIQRQTYSIIAGGTGSGKTTLALYSYVYRPIMDHLGDMKFRVVYFSLEMTAEILLAKILSLHIFETYGIELSYKDIMSRQEILSDDYFQLIESCIPWLEEFCKHVTIYDSGMSALGLYAVLSKYAEKHGTFTDTETSKHYEPFIKDELVLIIVDHLGLLNLNTGQTKKDAMDLASKFLMRFRNTCAYSPLVLLQINRGQSNMARVKEQRQEIELSDIKDTGGPSEDAEVILAIFHPHREKLGSHKGFNIRTLQDKYRAIQILKSRLGEADKSIGVNFFGSIGYWKELPKPEDMRENSPEDMEQYLYLSKQYRPKVVEPTAKVKFTLKL